MELLEALGPHVPRFRFLLDDLSVQSDADQRARSQMTAGGRVAILSLKHGRDQVAIRVWVLAPDGRAPAAREVLASVDQVHSRNEPGRAGHPARAPCSPGGSRGGGGDHDDGGATGGLRVEAGQVKAHRHGRAAMPQSYGISPAVLGALVVIFSHELRTEVQDGQDVDTDEVRFRDRRGPFNFADRVFPSD